MVWSKGIRRQHRVEKYGGLALAALQLAWNQKVVEETKEEEEARRCDWDSRKRTPLPVLRLDQQFRMHVATALEWLLVSLQISFY